MESLEVWSDLVSVMAMVGAIESPMAQRGVVMGEVDDVRIRRPVKEVVKAGIFIVSSDE